MHAHRQTTRARPARPPSALRCGATAFAALLSLLSPLFTGCALREGADDLDIQVVGAPVDAAALSLIPGALRSSRLLQDGAGEPWLAVSTPDEVLTPGIPDPQAELDGPLHVYKLTPPYSHYRIDTMYTALPATPSRSLCSYQQGRDGLWTISLLAPGNADTNRFEVGTTAPLLLCGQRSLAYWQLGQGNKILPIIRRFPDGSVYRRDFAWPNEANPMYQQGPQFFDEREDVLFLIDGDYHTQALYIDTGEQVDLGPMYWGQTVDRLFIGMDFDGALWMYDIDAKKALPIGYRVSTVGNVLGIRLPSREIVTCDWDGLRALALPRVDEPVRVVAPQRVLDATPCEIKYSRLERLGEYPIYSPDSGAPTFQVRAVPIDGRSAPSIMLSNVDGVVVPADGNAEARSVVKRIEDTAYTAIVLAGVCQNRATFYRTTPDGIYGLGVSDGWMNGQRFMERGRDVRFSPDCDHLYFKEHAANVRKLGTLYALPVPADSTRDRPLQKPLRLAYNVGLIALMPDGRLLASTDLAVLGSHNRIVAIDIKTRQAQAMAWGVNAVTRALFVGSYIPGRREIVLEVRDGSVGGLHGMVVLGEGEGLPPR